MTPQEQYAILVDYARMKLFQKDWHCVCDAANDIRESLAKYPELEKV